MAKKILDIEKRSDGNKVLYRASKLTGVSRKSIRNSSLHGITAIKRACIGVLKDYFEYTLEDIGLFFSRSTPTIHSHYHRHKYDLEDDPKYADMYYRLLDMCKNLI